MLPLLFSILTFQTRKSKTHKQIQHIQQKQFRSLLRYVFDNSPFYRELYSSQGIKKDDLNEIPISDLPFTSKELLMENFDDVVTNKRLKKTVLQDWIETHKDTQELFENEFVVIHTSGTSGNLGIFVYDQKAWNTLKGSLVTRVSQVNLNPFKKTKIAFYGATHGRFAGVSLVNDAPGLLYERKMFSLLTPVQNTIEELNKFQPNQLSGYSSTIEELAEFQIQGKLHINPKRIMVSGDPLTEKRETVIQKAWNIQVSNLYAASESIGIAARLPGTKYMTVFDDLHIVEILDEKMQEVQEKDSGQIVLTNLYNRTLPLIRYTMKDIAEKGMLHEDGQFSAIKNIVGRVRDALPIRLDNNEIGTLPPSAMGEFFLPGLEKVQFISHNPSHVQLKYIAKRQMDKQVKEKFKGLLRMKGAGNGTKVAVEKVDSLPNDPKTGKFKLVILHK